VARVVRGATTAAFRAELAACRVVSGELVGDLEIARGHTREPDPRCFSEALDTCAERHGLFHRDVLATIGAS
jgi:hypothetical protein